MQSDETRRSKVVDFNASPREVEQIKHAALREGLPLASFVRRAALLASREADPVVAA